MAVVSATFESGVGLSGYIQLSCFLELQNAELRKLMNVQPVPYIAHGLGTYRWLVEDVTLNPLRICPDPHSGIIEASAAEANRFLKSFQINQKFVCRKFTEEQVRRYQLTVDLNGFSYLIEVLEVGQRTNVSKSFKAIVSCFSYLLKSIICWYHLMLPYSFSFSLLRIWIYIIALLRNVCY